MDCLASQEGATDEKHSGKTTTPILCQIHSERGATPHATHKVMRFVLKQSSSDGNRSQREGLRAGWSKALAWTHLAGGSLSGITTREGCSALWGAWWVEISAKPISTLCLVVRRGSPASSSLLKGLLFPRLPLTFLISEKSCPLGWRVRNGIRKEELFGNLSMWFWEKGAEWERGVMATCRLCLDSPGHRHPVPEADFSGSPGPSSLGLALILPSFWGLPNWPLEVFSPGRSPTQFCLCVSWVAIPLQGRVPTPIPTIFDLPSRFQCHAILIPQLQEYRFNYSSMI